MIPTEKDIASVWPDVGEITAIHVTGATHTINVGEFGVSRYEKWAKPGEHSWLPYVRVWAGDKIISEHIQHALSAVFFAQ